MKFKLLAGFHVDADKSQPKISYLPNIPEEQKIYPDRRFKQGDIIETDTDLCARLNVDGCPPKFERVDQYANSVQAPAVRDGLDELTLKQLNELAESYEVDLKGNTKKDAVVAILRGYQITPEPVGV